MAGFVANFVIFIFVGLFGYFQRHGFISHHDGPMKLSGAQRSNRAGWAKYLTPAWSHAVGLELYKLKYLLHLNELSPKAPNKCNYTR